MINNIDENVRTRKFLNEKAPNTNFHFYSENYHPFISKTFTLLFPILTFQPISTSISRNYFKQYLLFYAY